MSFKVERLTRLTIKGKEDIYDESEIKELRDILLQIYPLEKSYEFIPKIPILNDLTWIKENHTYRKGRTSISLKFVEKILNYFIENKDSKFQAKELKIKFSPSNSNVYHAIAILRQEKKICIIYEDSNTFYALDKTYYNLKLNENSLQSGINLSAEAHQE